MFFGNFKSESEFAIIADYILPEIKNKVGFLCAISYYSNFFLHRNKFLLEFSLGKVLGHLFKIN